MFFILSSLRGPASEALYLFLFFPLLSDAESFRLCRLSEAENSDEPGLLFYCGIISFL